MNVNYIEYMHPGSFVAESSEAPVAERVLPLPVGPRVAGYRFFSRTEHTEGGETLQGPKRDYSPWTYFGTEHTVAQLAESHGIDSTLYWNIANNGYSRAVNTIFGNWYPLSDGERVESASQGAQGTGEGEQRDR